MISLQSYAMLTGEAISEDEQGMVWTGGGGHAPAHPLPQRCSLSSPRSLRRPLRHRQMLR